MRDHWAKFVKDDGWVPRKSSYLCIKHFKHSDICHNNMRVRLQKNAIPVYHTPSVHPTVQDAN